MTGEGGLSQAASATIPQCRANPLSLAPKQRNSLGPIISKEMKGYKYHSILGPLSLSLSWGDILPLKIIFQQIYATPLLHLLFQSVLPFSSSQDAMAPNSLPPPFAQVVWLEEWLSVTFCWWVTFAARAARRRPSKQEEGGWEEGRRRPGKVRAASEGRPLSPQIGPH